MAAEAGQAAARRSRELHYFECMMLSFCEYALVMNNEVCRRQRSLELLTDEERAMLPLDDMKLSLRKFHRAALINSVFLARIATTHSFLPGPGFDVSSTEALRFLAFELHAVGESHRDPLFASDRLREEEGKAALELRRRPASPARGSVEAENASHGTRRDWEPMTLPGAPTRLTPPMVPAPDPMKGRRFWPVRSLLAEQRKVHRLFHSIMREWTVEGAEERAETLDVLVAELLQCMPAASKGTRSPEVLVPGCGLCRLALQIAREGYVVEGNEVSLHLLSVAHFMLNCIHTTTFEIFPWIDSPSNHATTDDALRSLTVPDLAPSQLLPNVDRDLATSPRKVSVNDMGSTALRTDDPASQPSSCSATTTSATTDQTSDAQQSGRPSDDEEATQDDGDASRKRQRSSDASGSPSCSQSSLSVTAGDFLEIYADQASEWDAIVTSFYLDCVPCVVQYIQSFYRLLRPGGFWINMGPLLWHWAPDLPGARCRPPFADPRQCSSLELTWDQLRSCIEVRPRSALAEDRWRF